MRVSKSSKSVRIASTARCVGLRNINVNQSRFAEVMTDYAYYKATSLPTRQGAADVTKEREIKMTGFR